MKIRLSLNNLFIPLAACSFAACNTGNADRNAEKDYSLMVNTFIGTDFTGNTYPGATVPFGMVQLSPDNGVPGWHHIPGYYYPDSTIAGFSHTHLTGVGAGDMYDIMYMPVTNPYNEAKDSPLGIHSKFSHDMESSFAGYYQVMLDDYGINVELTATDHCGIQRYTFPEADASVFLNLKKAMNWDATVNTAIEVVDSTTLRGFRSSTGWAKEQTVYFYARLSRPFDKIDIEKTPIKTDGKTTGEAAIAKMDFRTNDKEQLVIMTGLSSVSMEGAQKNLEAETDGFDFEQYVDLAKEKWNKELAKIEITTGDKDLETVFYTALYHTMTAPTILSDVDGQYIGADRKIHKADNYVQYGTFSLWDTYRAAHPLYTYLTPDRVNDMVKSLMAQYREIGRLPVWNFYGNETDMMIGYHSVPVIVDAYMKGIGDFDAEEALEACIATANIDEYRGIGLYKKYGYIPYNLEGESLSKTLEYSFDDWCIARMAEKMGKKEVADEFYKRAGYYKNLYNPATRFIQPKDDKGNWITGFDFIDNWLIGADQSQLPAELADNKGHNVFYCLPLLLGLIGIFWQLGRGTRGLQSFWVVFFLFFMTGLAIVLYLNQTPLQPRERDYAYAGSFYAFAIWIGMGVAALIHYVNRLVKKQTVAAAALVSLLCLLVPIQMASQTWDDHDRSGRYVARDFGQNYLATTQEEGNPIIYCCGDNDTFPLWYNLETEGFRTDVRACNLSFLQTDWYVEQMKRPAYDSPSLPLSIPTYRWTEIYRDSPVVPVRAEHKNIIRQLYAEHPAEMEERYGKEPFEISNILKYWVGSSDPSMRCIPTDTLYLSVDKEAVKRSGMMIPDSIPDRMAISVKGKSMLSLSDLAMLDMIAHSNWERPLYMAVTVGEDNFISDLQRYFVLEGMAYRITPFAKSKPRDAIIDTERMYDNLMHKFKNGGVDKEGIYLDENAMRICYTHQKMYISLAEKLFDTGDHKRALEVLDKCDEFFPAYNVPYILSGESLTRAELYYKLGEKEKAEAVVDYVLGNSLQYMKWYMTMDDDMFARYFNDLRLYMALAHYFYEDITVYGSTELLEKYEADVKSVEQSVLMRINKLD